MGYHALTRALQVTGDVTCYMKGEGPKNDNVFQVFHFLCLLSSSLVHVPL